MSKLNNILILVPLYNEAPVLPELFDRLEKLGSSTAIHTSVLFIDDGSNDSTSVQLEENISGKANYSAIFLSRNFGHAMAITAGLANVPDSMDAVFIIDGDLQDPPELLPDFIAKMESGYDVVYGIRKNRKEGFLKKACYRMYYRLLKRFSNIKMPLDAGDFSLVSKKVVNELNKLPEESRYLRGLRSWVGFPQAGIEYNRENRKNGSSKYSLRSLFKLAFNGLFNFSEVPIRFIGMIGFISIVISLAYLGVTVYKKLMFGTVPEGFTALIFAIVLFSGVQLLSLGIIGEYILRIFFQVKQRPLYIVKSKIINGNAVHE
ncbi:MAG: glycosyltransferase [Chitinophagaceae bacterium]|nr:MAG: glycosyltransferase [Chitinophagaceae bacterium]